MYQIKFKKGHWCPIFFKTIEEAESKANPFDQIWEVVPKEFYPSYRERDDLDVYEAGWYSNTICGPCETEAECWAEIYEQLASFDDGSDNATFIKEVD